MTIIEIAALVLLVPLLLLVAAIFWPLALCWYMGSPALGVIAQVVWFVVLKDV